MAMSKGYGPTGVSYFLGCAQFIEIVRDGAQCSLIVGSGARVAVELRGLSEDELRAVYAQSAGIVGWSEESDKVQLVEFDTLAGGFV